MAHSEKTKKMQKEFENLLNNLVTFFDYAGFQLNRKEPFLQSILNRKWLQNLIIIIFYIYVLFFEPLDKNLAVEVIWWLLMLSQGYLRGINCAFHGEYMKDTFKWFKKLYEPDKNEEFQSVKEKILKKQNQIVKFLLNYLPKMTLCSSSMFMFLPLLTLTKVLPGPMIFNGSLPSSYPWPIFIAAYAFFAYLIFHVSSILVAGDCFFAVSATILVNRLNFIENIVKLLNYEGVRNGKKDKEILRTCYEMHLEILQKISSFSKYFNFYGIYHLTSTMMVIAIVTYKMEMHGADGASIALFICIFGEIVLVCYFGEKLHCAQVSVYDSLCDLNWYNFQPCERKCIWFMMMKSQEPLHLVAGNVFNLSFPLITKILKFEISLLAFIKAL